MVDDNSIVDELKEAFKDLGIPETSVADNDTIPSANSKPKFTQGSVKPASSFDPKKINEVIFLEKQVVEPERLNAIRASISKWSNSIPHHDLTNLGEKIEIVSATENPSYIIELQTLYEKRTLKRGVKPFSGEKVFPKTITDENVDIWANPTADEKDFKEEKKNYIIEGSSEVLVCEKCDGAGEFICGRCGGDKTQTCPGCKGEGEVKCRKCGGEGTIKCSSCSGEGQTKCSACRGKGSISCPIILGCGGLGYKGSGNNRRACPYCKGAGSTPCTSCGTRGHKPCTACGSRGYKQCDSCKNGYKTCEKCNRKGIVTCGGCNGRGIVICSLCEGKKSIIKFLYYEDIFYPNDTAELVHSLNQPLINSIVESDKNNAHAVVDITQAEISGNIFDTIQHDAVKQNLTKLLVAYKTVSILGVPGIDYRILKQRIAINKYDIVIVNYSYLSKSYSLLIHGTNTKTVYVKTSPIHQLVDNYLASAGQLFKQKKYSQALDLVDKILNISPEKAEAEGLKKHIIDKINGEYALGGITGGAITAMFFRLTWVHNAPFWGNTWWDTLKISLFLFMGLMTGLIVAGIFVDKASTKIKESRKRVFYPFIVSALTTIFFVMSLDFAVDKFWKHSNETKTQEENLESAEETVDKALKHGNSYYHKGEYDKAVEEYSKAIALNPNYAEAYSNRGAAYNEKGQYDKAIEDSIKAIALNPYYAAAYNNRGTAYGNKGQRGKAKSDFQKACDMGSQEGCSNLLKL
ncbi:MAG: hypothetical protein A2Z47_13215 [Thermodesulfovibrio sp. RBG_19FT_COMBO_42_12]|nr:MAG: hypothetical protein A2Z47_13215 [Thermodesulfovibrio sp. RBG_19FT_COMBO_42_12]